MRPDQRFRLLMPSICTAKDMLDLGPLCSLNPLNLQASSISPKYAEWTSIREGGGGVHLQADAPGPVPEGRAAGQGGQARSQGGSPGGLGLRLSRAHRLLVGDQGQPRPVQLAGLRDPARPK